MSHEAEKRWQVRVDEAMQKLPGPKGERWATVLEHGTLDVEIYAPRGHDPQKPHDRDEVYVVVQGRGEFRRGAIRERFAPGDVIFVPAHLDHAFATFTDDLVVWVIFYGPAGGEASMGNAP